jgi:hypothetical protein
MNDEKLILLAEKSRKTRGLADNAESYYNFANNVVTDMMTKKHVEKEREMDALCFCAAAAHKGHSDAQALFSSILSNGLWGMEKDM